MRVHSLFVAITCCWLSVSQAQSQSSRTAKPAARPPAAQTATAPVTPLAVPDSVTVSVAKLSNYLSGHTASRREFVRQLYTWITTHISYDVANAFTPNLYKDTADAALKTLQQRQAVCQGYASLYYLACRQAGIPAYLVSGYTRSNGQLDNASHAWVAVQLDNTWYMTDPTWGAGGVLNGKFVRKPTDQYYLVSPTAFVRHHIPFDPLWQLLEHPYRHEEFRDSNWDLAAQRPLFSYRDSLALYNTQDELARCQQAAGRIERYGVTNPLTGQMLQHLRDQAGVIQHNRQADAQNRIVDKLNNSGTYYNQAVSLFNSYVEYRNAQFKPARPDEEIREMVNAIAARLQQSRQELAGITTDDVSLRQNMQSLQQSQSDMQRRVEQEQAFVEKYIKTGKMFRKTLFYKWTGI